MPRSHRRSRFHVTVYRMPGMARASGYEGEGGAIMRWPTSQGAEQALLG
jgi:hypothetical protein